MKVHLKQIPAEGTHLKGKEKTDILELEDDQIRPLGTVEYSLDIGVSGSSLFVTGKLAWMSDWNVSVALSDSSIPSGCKTFPLKSS